MKSLKHIFFDLDHTLWDFHSNSIETLGELYKEFQLSVKGDGPEAFFIDRYVHHNERLWGLYRENQISKGRLRKARFELALADIGVHDKKLARDLGDAYLDQCPRKTGLMPGAKQILELFQEHFQLHILSNGFHETQKIKLKQSGLEGYFTEVITSERAQAKKPHKRMYEFAAKVTKADPSQSLMIGDNLDIDVKGALDFGWRAIHFNPEGKPSSSECVQSLTDLSFLVSE